MKTKLVYVLTCSPKDFYIEQALMAVYSARYWNQDAHIVLIVDNLTNQFLSGKRSEILDYISEKIVITFEDDSLSMTYRSRYIKTSVREIINGDFLFIDSDTVTQKSLSDIDTFHCEVGAVLESHLRVEEFCDSLYDLHQERLLSIGVDLSEERLYFSSGVLFVKDTPATHALYYKWFQYWNEGTKKGLFADQPALCKANQESKHIIEQIPDTYNCILFTQPPFTSSAFILHISSYRNPSFLFTKKVLHFIKENGLNNDWIRQSILNPCSTFLPFDYQLFHSTKAQRRKWKEELSVFFKGYRDYIDASFEDFPMSSRFRAVIIWFLQHGYIRFGIASWLSWSLAHLHLKNRVISDNICRK